MELDFFCSVCVCVYIGVVVIALQVHFSDVCLWTTSLGLSAHTRPENVQQERERRGTKQEESEIRWLQCEGR